LSTSPLAKADCIRLGKACRGTIRIDEADREIARFEAHNEENWGAGTGIEGTSPLQTDGVTAFSFAARLPGGAPFARRPFCS
jgi:hypothetical protein